MSHLSVHCGVGGNHNGLGAFLDQMVFAGFTPWLKSIDSYGPLIDAINRGGYGVFRLSTRGQNDGYDYDVPFRYTGDPVDAAFNHWFWTRSALPPEFDKDHVWLEVMNEVDKNEAEWLGVFALEIARLANADGYKILMFGFSSGEPEPEFWDNPNVRLYLEYCAGNPDRAGIALHEYNYGLGSFESVYPSHVGRFQYLYDACDRHGIDRPLVAMTEWGFSQDTVPSWEAGGDYARKCFELYSRFAIDGPALWCLQAYQGHPVPNQANAFMKAMTPFLVSVGPQKGDRNAHLDPDYFTPGQPPPLDQWIWQQGMAQKVIDTNSDAALERAMGADGYLQTGNEKWSTGPDGKQYAVQPAYSAQTGENRVYYAEVPNWGEIRIQTEPGGTEPPPIEPPPAYEIVDIIDELPKHENKKYAFRLYSDITSIVIHHSAVRPEVGLQAIAAYHVNNNNWPGIGYHFGITAEGEIYQTNRLETISYHVGAQNRVCVGICLLGNFTDEAPPAVQLDAAKLLVAHLKEHLPGTKGTGHRLVPQTATSCPGNTFDEWLPYVIGDEIEPPPPDPDTVDLLPFFLPRGVDAWMLQTSWGPQEKVRGVHNAADKTFYHVKNSNWEQLHYDDDTIYRSVDTSPGVDVTGRDRYYAIADDGLPFSKWLMRHGKPGDWFERSPTVQFFYKDNCEHITTYHDHSWLHVVAIHDTYHFELTNMVMHDVLELAWSRERGGTPIERYWYAGGLVGWMRTDNGDNSAIESFTDGDNQMEIIPCL